MEVNGHNIGKMIEVLKMSKVMLDKPTAIVLNTIPGKGVEFMEDLPEWHGKPPMKPGEAVEALDDIHDIRTLGGRIINEYD